MFHLLFFFLFISSFIHLFLILTLLPRFWLTWYSCRPSVSQASFCFITILSFTLFFYHCSVFCWTLLCFLFFHPSMSSYNSIFLFFLCVFLTLPLSGGDSSSSSTGSASPVPHSYDSLEGGSYPGMFGSQTNCLNKRQTRVHRVFMSCAHLMSQGLIHPAFLRVISLLTLSKELISPYRLMES